MTDLIDFVRARLAEDEAVARDVIESEAGAAEWSELSSGVLVTGPPTHDDTWEGTHPIGDSRITRFIARHDPARVLREVEANRLLVEFWSRAFGKASDFPGVDWDRVRSSAQWTLRLLALPYADHEDFKEEWRT